LTALGEGPIRLIALANSGHEGAMDSPHELRAKAERYKRMTSAVTDPQALEALRELGARYEAIAAELEGEDPPSSSDAGLD
jgi:hypothetical protein